MHEEARRLRLASWNVHRCIGVDGVRDHDRVAAVVRELDADAIVLQEIEAEPTPEAVLDQLLVLADATGLTAVAGTVLTDRRGGYGNALLTRRPVASVRRIDLSISGREPRGAIDVTLALGASFLRIVGTHLGLRAAERRSQLGSLLEKLGPASAEPMVVLGDFNEWLPTSRNLRGLQGRFGRPAAPRTFPSWRPVLALDRIWAEPHAMLHAIGVHRSPLARIASDHLPVWATVVMEDA